MCEKMRGVDTGDILKRWHWVERSIACIALFICLERIDNMIFVLPYLLHNKCYSYWYISKIGILTKGGKLLKLASHVAILLGICRMFLEFY